MAQSTSTILHRNTDYTVTSIVWITCVSAYVCRYGHLHMCVYATVDIGIYTQAHKQIHLSLIIT